MVFIFILFFIALAATIGLNGIAIIIASVVGLLIFFYIKLSIQEKRREKERKVQQETEAHNQQLRNFYQMCQKAGISAIRTNKDLQKAQQIANTMHLNHIDVKAFYLEAVNLLEQEQQEKDTQARRKVEAELEKIRNAEREKCEKLEQYADYSGQEKRLAMLRSQYQTASERASTMRNASKVLCQPLVSAPKEADWAIHGGIASGIAGPAAGLATALDIQQQNAANRAQADAINSAYVSSLVRSGVLEKAAQSEKQYKSEAEKLHAQIQEAETALVADDSPQKCFERLCFDETTITVSETGTCSVMTYVYLKKNFTIFNNVDACVDGTILAEICDGSSVIGCAKLVLPVYGANKVADELEGMALFCGHPGGKYTVRFKAGNLWAMEEMS